MTTAEAIVLTLLLWPRVSPKPRPRPQPAPTPKPGPGTIAIPPPPKAEWVQLSRGPVTLVPGTFYRCTIQLQGMEAAFGTKDAVAQRLQEKAGPWRYVNVQDHGGGRFTATGQCTGSERTVRMPEQVTAVFRRA